jgi:phosphoribosylamine-glycine ligase
LENSQKNSQIPGINVLEFNCRFGDPETQVLLPLLDSDLLSICEACVEGRLDSIQVAWKSQQYAATVVVASQGYPGTYPTGHAISGLDRVNGPLVFHAGTKSADGKIVTSGGRVLAVTSVGPSLEKALEQSYAALQEIKFDGAYYRKDIGYKALNLNTASSSVTYKDSGNVLLLFIANVKVWI